jgi:hypothetical protein
MLSSARLCTRGRRHNASFSTFVRGSRWSVAATRQILSESFDESSRQFMDALAAAMPDLPRRS